MHSYSIDSNERPTIYLILAAISILATFTLNLIFGKLNLTIPWFVETPSVMSIYGLLCLCFTKVFWKLNLLHKIGLVNTPVLIGKWNGEVQSSFDQHSSKQEVVIEIKQDWTNIQICLRGKNSNSKSQNASITVQDGLRLTYDYLNEPSPDANQNMNIHRGTAILELSSDGSFEGEYYSGRGRQSFGRLKMEKFTNNL